MERSLANSPGSSVIGVSSRRRAHCSRENIRYGLYTCSGARTSMTPPLTCLRRARPERRSIALARRLLFESGDTGPLLERGFDFLELHAARFQKHQQMKQQVCAFRDQMVAVLADGGDHGLHRLLAELFGAMLRPPVQELAGVRRLPARLGAGIDDAGQIMNRETRHQLGSIESTRYAWLGKEGQPSRRPVALPSQRVVRDRAASAARHAPYGPWPHVW